jgi:hypothetical protein
LELTIRISGTVDRKMADGVLVGCLGAARVDDRQEQRRHCFLHRQHALDAVDHVAGGEFAAVVELHAFLQVEGPGLAVGRGGVTLGQPRDHLRRIVDPAVQPVVEVDARRGTADVEDGVRIEIVVAAVVGMHVLALRPGLACNDGR